MGKRIILTADIKEKATTKFGFFNPTTTSLLYALIIILGFEFVKGVREKILIFSAYTKKVCLFLTTTAGFLSDITDKNLKSRKVSVISDRIPKSGKVSVISDKIPNIKNR